MHSYHNNLLPNHFDDYFVPISSIHSHSTRLSTSNNLFLPRVAQKCDLQYQILPIRLTPLCSNGNLRNTSYMKIIHNYVFNNFHFMRNKMLNLILILLIWILSVVFVLCVSLLFCLLLFPVHIPFSRTKLHSIIFIFIFFNLYFIKIFYFYIVFNIFVTKPNFLN